MRTLAVTLGPRVIELDLLMRENDSMLEHNTAVI